MIRNKIDHILDRLPEDELESLYWTIDYFYQKYLSRKNLKVKGVIISGIVEESTEIIEKWEKVFASSISEEVKESIHYNQYKWHIFSYNQQTCMKQDEARSAFDRISKDEVYVMYENSPFVELYRNAKDIVSTDLDSEQDIYLFDPHFRWTYVHTHESMCGPYFCTL